MIATIISFLVRQILSFVIENQYCSNSFQKIPSADNYTEDDARFLHLIGKGAFITNAEANFMEFSISIKDGIK